GRADGDRCRPLDGEPHAVWSADSGPYKGVIARATVQAVSAAMAAPLDEHPWVADSGTRFDSEPRKITTEPTASENVRISQSHVNDDVLAESGGNSALDNLVSTASRDCCSIDATPGSCRSDPPSGCGVGATSSWAAAGIATSGASSETPV